MKLSFGTKDRRCCLVCCLIPAGSVDSDAVGRVWQAFGYSSGSVQLSFMGTVLVSSSACRELVVDDVKAHHNFERQVDLIDDICRCLSLEAFTRWRECADGDVRHALYLHLDVVRRSQVDVGLA